MYVRGPSSDRGASAVTVAVAMVVLMGMAAIAIDLGLGFNERRQDQTAADVAVMAGAVEVTLGADQQTIVSEVLQFARDNLDTSYTDGEWESIWESCSDPAKDSFDVGIGSPVSFQPMQNLFCGKAVHAPVLGREPRRWAARVAATWRPTAWPPVCKRAPSSV